ncbi:MAG: aspartate kinase [Myxococcota bacterium]|jgi:aspartate kinase
MTTPATPMDQNSPTAPAATATDALGSIVVQKYGGSSLATLEKVQDVARRIAATVQAGHRVVAVVSAMGKTTDGLLSQAKSLSDNPNARELDMLMSVGERISTALLAIALYELGLPAVSFTGSQSGIITNTRHNRARIVEVRPYRVADELDAGKVVIVAGYQGVSYAREITTLGRGGTDTTAVALAAALDAEYCEICSDVDGVYTADPRVVLDAKRLDALSHAEMIALARSGSRVLNQDCVEFASLKGVAIFAKATFGPKDDSGTVIRKNPSPEPRLVTAIAHRTKVLELTTQTATTSESVDTLDVIDALATLGALPHAMSTGAHLHVVVPTDDAHRLDAVRTQLSERFGDALSTREDRGTVTAIGLGLGEAPELIKRAVRAIRNLVGGAYELTLGPLELTFTLGSEHVEDAVRALHAVLIERA